MSDEDLVKRLRHVTEFLRPDAEEARLMREAADYIEHFHVSHDAMAKEIERLTRERDEAQLGNHSASEHEPTWSQLADYWKHRAEAAERKVERLREALINAKKSLLQISERDTNADMVNGLEEGPCARIADAALAQICAALAETEKGDE